MKKCLSLLLAMVCVLALAACGTSSEDPAVSTEVQPSGIVSDIEHGDTELHEVIVPWKFEEGEEVDNPYYKRTVDADGNPVFAVEKASNGQVAYLPMNETVIYSGEYESCYYEMNKMTYTLDGEPREAVQYQLYVTATAPVEQPAETIENHPAVSEVETP